MIDFSSNSYLLRAEMIGLHEAEVSYQKNPIRGAQFYPNCIQLEVQGDGEVELPEGVSFPGAYKWDDPGVIYDVGQPPPTPLFPISAAPNTTYSLLHHIHSLLSLLPLPYIY